jgi:hypothetical protein
MIERHAWVIEIERALGRIDENHRAMEASLLGVQADYRLIAETIKAAIREQKINQKEVAQLIGKSTTWVSRTLAWHTKGCRSESPFADEIAARRRARNVEAKIATSQSKEGTADADRRQRSFFDADGRYVLQCPEAPLVPEQADAASKAISLMGACRALIEAANVNRNILAVVRRSPIDERIFTLQKLESDLTKSIAAGTRALEEVRAVLKETPEFLEAAE